MNILLVEDDENKRNQVSNLISTTYSQANIKVAKSYQSGLRSIISSNFDLVLLDMTMPTFDIGVDEDGGRPQPFAGREILRQMERRNIITPVIVITQFDKFGDENKTLTLEELNQELQEAHPHIYNGAVYYDVIYGGWEQELISLITQLTKETQL